MVHVENGWAYIMGFHEQDGGTPVVTQSLFQD